MTTNWTPDYMKGYVEEHSNLVAKKPVVSHRGLSVLKYKNRVFYRNLWTPEICEFRGTVVDENFNIVMRPFTKIFNYGENHTRINRDELCTAVEKVNGFMSHVTVRDGKVLVATTGSMDSDFAELAKKWLLPYKEDFLEGGEGFTYIFEIVDPDDPHIINEKPGVYLLAVRLNAWNTPQSFLTQVQLDSLAASLSSRKKSFTDWIKRPKWYDKTRFQDIKDMSRSERIEGYVVYGEQSGISLKLKTPYYLATKFVGRMTDERLEKLLTDTEQFRKTIDEEFYPLIDDLLVNKDTFKILSKQERVMYVRDFFDRTLS